MDTLIAMNGMMGGASGWMLFCWVGGVLLLILLIVVIVKILK
jgi:uncharacterized membrane protein